MVPRKLLNYNFASRPEARLKLLDMAIFRLPASRPIYFIRQTWGKHRQMLRQVLVEAYWRN